MLALSVIPDYYRKGMIIINQRYNIPLYEVQNLPITDFIILMKEISPSVQEITDFHFIQLNQTLTQIISGKSLNPILLSAFTSPQEKEELFKQERIKQMEQEMKEAFSKLEQGA